MNTLENKTIDIPLEGKDKKKIPVKQLAYAGIAIAVVGVISFGSITIYKNTQPKQLPANVQCTKALDAASVNLKAYTEQLQNALQGKPVAVADLSSITNAAQECKANINNYNVTLEAK
jgi:hypothetical protein